MSEHSEPNHKTLSELDSFLLTYSVMPSFQADYGIHVVFENGRLRAWSEPGPAMALMDRAKDFPNSPGLPLALEDAFRIVAILKRARITPFVRGKTGCDGVSYKLTLTQGWEKLEFGWWEDLPKGWRGLQPLQDLLERYATRFSQENGEQSIPLPPPGGPGTDF